MQPKLTNLKNYVSQLHDNYKIASTINLNTNGQIKLLG